MKKTRENKGITLIALVITIIVLLILAGVAIAMLSGENGILRKAAEAKTKTEESQKAEQATLIDYEIDGYFIEKGYKYKCRYGYITGIKETEKAENLKHILETQGYKLRNIENTEDVARDTTLTTGMSVTKNGEIIARTVIFGDVDCNGKIDVFDGNDIVDYTLGNISNMNEYSKVAADSNGDGKVTSSDANQEYYTGDIKINQNRYANNKIRVITNKEMDNDTREHFKEKLKNSKYTIEDVDYDGDRYPALKGVTNTTKVGEILDVFADENVSIMNSDSETCQRDDVIGNEYTIKYQYKEGRDMDICYILNI